MKMHVCGKICQAKLRVLHQLLKMTQDSAKYLINRCRSREFCEWWMFQFWGNLSFLLAQILCGPQNESFQSLFFSTHWNLLLISKCCCYVLSLLTISSVICFPLLFFGSVDLSLFHTASFVSSTFLLAVKDTSAPTLNQRKPTHRKHSSSTGLRNPGGARLFLFPYTLLLFFFDFISVSFPCSHCSLVQMLVDLRDL